MLHWCSWVRALPDTDLREIDFSRQVFMGVYMLVLMVALCRLPYPVLKPVATILPVVCAAISYCVLCLDGVHVSTASLKVSCVRQK